MKLALAITGHLRRNFEDNLIVFLSNLKQYTQETIDIYAVIMDKDDYGRPINSDSLWNINTRFKDCAQLIKARIIDTDEYQQNKPTFTLKYDRKLPIKEILKLTKAEVFNRFMVKEQAEQRGTHCGFGPEAMEYWFNRIMDQYHGINQTYRIMEDIGQYDLIFRFRPDFRILKNIPIRTDLFNTFILIQGYDCFQYGSPKVMRKYFNLYHHLNTYENDLNYLNRYGYDTFNSENMLRHYMKKDYQLLYDVFDVYEEKLIEGRDFVLGR